jgi:hypothetical protein
MNNSVSPISNENLSVTLPGNIDQNSLVPKSESKELLSITRKRVLLTLIPLSFHSLGIIFGDM